LINLVIPARLILFHQTFSMQQRLFIKAGIFSVIIVIAVVISWEFYLRNKGTAIYYDDGGPLFADKRAKVYEPSDRTVVFTGSSRIKFDLDIPSWRNITGTDAIQLANVGTSALPILEELANDPKFKGRLVVDVTEPLYFSAAPQNLGTALKNIDYYNKRTPAQRFSFELNHGLESKLVFLNQQGYSLTALLDRLQVPSRPGVFVFPTFPRSFQNVTFDRQNVLVPAFMADTNDQNQVKGIWKFFGDLARSMPPTPKGVVDTMFLRSKWAVDKIKARGGDVIFIRTPSSGPMYQGELMGFPRSAYWERLLQTTGCKGVYFKDYPAIANFRCPEFSHLSPPDVLVFTKELARILNEEAGWKFPNKS
jgi:hypothetical protein